MSFSTEIKFELLDSDFSIEQGKAIIMGIAASAGRETGSWTHITINNSEIFNDILSLIKNTSIQYSLLNNKVIVIKSFPKNIIIENPAFFMAGIFVGGGSVTEPKKTSHHLELQFHYHLYAQKIQNLMKKYDINFKLIQRRSKFVLYLKKQVLITDFFYLINAITTAQELEDARITRDYQNYLVRLSNFDVYNMKRLSAASYVFREMYEYCEKNNILNFFNVSEQNFFKMKYNNLELSLQQLAVKYNKQYGTNKTRAGLNHWIYKMKENVGAN